MSVPNSHTPVGGELRKIIEAELWTGDVLPYDGITRIVSYFEKGLLTAHQKGREEERERILRLFDKYNPALVQQVKEDDRLQS